MQKPFYNSLSRCKSMDSGCDNDPCINHRESMRKAVAHIVLASACIEHEIDVSTSYCCIEIGHGTKSGLVQ
jgi:hypothetical protein